MTTSNKTDDSSMVEVLHRQATYERNLPDIDTVLKNLKTPLSKLKSQQQQQQKIIKRHVSGVILT